ncbi:sigma D regulator [Saccharobesus litoralis]|uniref:Sigma D regulator n=1 Tax=Saccharobesus litoralis TaxID=2172099 RepID=A0A2S0VSD7_9ALTE|nr:sigma D regulator [Saccharobesus litoralis]AWB67117.1 sigma D regulator [Saccharobesus litoralis]
MLSRLESTQAQYGGASKVIDSWLEERQEWLVRYCQLAGLPPFEKNAAALPNQTEVQAFCQVMMDYLSAGHFEIYDQIVSKCEVHGGESVELARSLTPKIAASTEIAVSFNDKYAEANGDDDYEPFDEDLSTLGQQMEERFEYEDKLIHTLYTKHTETA